jgi:hypothetical protein
MKKKNGIAASTRTVVDLPAGLDSAAPWSVDRCIHDLSTHLETHAFRPRMSWGLLASRDGVRPPRMGSRSTTS